MSVINQDMEYYLTADEIINGGHFSKELIEAAIPLFPEIGQHALILQVNGNFKSGFSVTIP